MINIISIVLEFEMIASIAILFLIVVLASFRINIYLGFVQSVGAINSLIAIHNNAATPRIDDLVISSIIVIFSCLLIQAYLQKNLKRTWRKAGMKQSGDNIKTEIAIVFLVLAPFYLYLTDTLILASWWRDTNFRMSYMTDYSTVLRAVKVTPILITMIIFSTSNLSVRSFCLAVLSSLLFTAYYGSKSGMIFLFAILTIHSSVVVGKFFKSGYALKLFSVFSILLASIYFFFTHLALESNNSIFFVISERLKSDILGYARAIDPTYQNLCSYFSILNPVEASINKIFSFSSAKYSHSSFGNCLASPENINYPFELLVPLALEQIALNGKLIGIIVYLALIFGFIVFFHSVGYVAKLLKIPYVGFCSQVYLTISFLGVIWGGKIGNFFVTEVLSVTTFISICAFMVLLLKSGAVNNRERIYTSRFRQT